MIKNNNFFDFDESMNEFYTQGYMVVVCPQCFEDNHVYSDDFDSECSFCRCCLFNPLDEFTLSDD